MAKKRKSSKAAPRRRRRRVSGIGELKLDGMLMSVGCVVGGVAAAGYLNKLALKDKSEMIQMLVPIGIGIALPMFLKNDLGKYAGLGLIAYGGGKFLQKQGLAGIGDDQMELTISGNDLRAIAGADDDDDDGMGDDDDDNGMNGEFPMAGGIDQISVLAGGIYEEG